MNYTYVQTGPGTISDAEYYIIRNKGGGMPGMVIGKIRGLEEASIVVAALNVREKESLMAELVRDSVDACMEGEE